MIDLIITNRSVSELTDDELTFDESGFSDGVRHLAERVEQHRVLAGHRVASQRVRRHSHVDLCVVVFAQLRFVAFSGSWSSTLYVDVGGGGGGTGDRGGEGECQYHLPGSRPRRLHGRSVECHQRVNFVHRTKSWTIHPQPSPQKQNFFGPKKKIDDAHNVNISKITCTNYEEHLTTDNTRCYIAQSDHLKKCVTTMCLTDWK